MTDDNGWTVKTLKELIEVRLKENNLRRDDQLHALEKKFDASVEDVERATQLLAKTYPTTSDFNRLKEHVDVTLAEGSGKTKNFMMFLTLVSTSALVISVLFAYLNFVAVK